MNSISRLWRGIPCITRWGLSQKHHTLSCSFFWSVKTHFCLCSSVSGQNRTAFLWRSTQTVAIVRRPFRWADLFLNVSSGLRFLPEEYFQKKIEIKHLCSLLITNRTALGAKFRLSWKRFPVITSVFGPKCLLKQNSASSDQSCGSGREEPSPLDLKQIFKGTGAETQFWIMTFI